MPPFAVGLIFKVASSANRVEEIFQLCVRQSIGVPEEALATIFDDCVKHSIKDLALRLEAPAAVGDESLIVDVAEHIEAYAA